MKRAKNRLAISCPHLGIPSETFIRRHIVDLCPDGAVVVVNKPIPVEEEAWSVDCAVYRAKNSRSMFLNLQRILSDSLGHGWKKPVDFKGIQKFLKEQQVDVMLGEYLDDAWPLLEIARSLGIKFFAHAHGYDLSCLLHNQIWREKLADYAQADGVIVVNRVMKERLITLGVHAEKIHIIPCGVDVPIQPVLRLPRASVHCLAVGRMVPKKGPLKLVEAFLEAIESGLDLYLDYIGTGPLFSEVSRFVERAGLGCRVRLLGGQEHRVVMDHMAKADIFLQHSIVDPETGDEEGMPVAVQEAMAMALPVVSTQHAGIPEIISHGETGFLVAEGDVVGMSEHIVALAREPELRQSIGVAAWSHARNQLTWEREKQALLKVLGF